MADVQAGYEQAERNEMVRFMRQLQSQTKVTPAPEGAPGPQVAPTSPATDPSWQGFRAETAGAARALYLGGKTIWEGEKAAFDHMMTGFSQMVAPASKGLLEQTQERADGLRKVVAAVISMGMVAPMTGAATAMTAPVIERYPWAAEYITGEGPIAQAFRDITNLGAPMLGPGGLTMVRPLEFLGETPSNVVQTYRAAGEYGKTKEGAPVPPLTLGEMLHTAAMYTVGALAVATAAKSGKAKPGEQPKAPPPEEPTPAPAAPTAPPAPATPTGQAPPLTNAELGLPTKGQPLPPAMLEGKQHAQLKGGTTAPPVEPQGAAAITPHLQEAPPEFVSSILDPQFATKPAVPADATAPRMYGINWTRLGTEESTKRVTMAVNQSLYEQTTAKLAAEGKVRTSEGAGGVRQTHAMTQAAAKASGMTIEDLAAGRFLKAGEDVGMLPAKRAAAEAIRDATDAHMWKLVDASQSGVVGAADDLKTTVALSRLLNQRVKEMTSATARALEYGKEKTSQAASPLFTGDIATTVENLTAEMSGEDMAGYLDSLRKTHGKGAAQGWATNVAEMARQAKNMGWEYFQLSKLTSPHTWVKNALGNAATMALEIPERALARLNHILFWPDDPLGTAPGEARALATGYRRATADTVKMLGTEYTQARAAGKGRVGALGQAHKALDDLPGVQHWDRDPAIAAHAVGIRGFTDMLQAAADRDPASAITAVPGAALDVVGAAVRSGGNVLATTDKVSQAINFGGQVEASALRQATLENRRYVGTPDYGARVGGRVAYITTHLGEFPSIVDQAKDAAQRNTYTHSLGPAGQAFESFMNKVPGMRLNFVFYRVPLNLFKRATHYFPPTWAISRVWGEMGDMWAQGGVARETALARLEIGVAASAALGHLVAEGKITGAGPTDPAMRARWQATGARPYSFYPEGLSPGAKGYQYNGIAPFGIHIGTIADIGEIFGQLPQDSPWYERALQLGAVSVMGLAQAMKDEPFSQGFSDMVSALHQPDQFAKQWSSNFLRGLVPTGWQRAQHVWIDDALKETRGPLDALRAAVWGPWVVDRRDVITGEPILYPPGLGPDIASPVTVSEVNPDPVAKELYDQRITVPRFPWATMGSLPAEFLQMTDVSAAKEGVPLTPQQRDRWIVLTTQEVTDRHGQNLHDRLQAMIEHPKYQALPVWPDNMSRQTELHSIINAYRRDALAKLRGEDPDLDLAMRQKFEEKTLKRLPVTHPRATGKPSDRFGPGLTIGR